MGLNNKFEDTENLFRAIYPENKKPSFWKNGKLSSAAFKDKNGLSVDRSGDRSNEQVYRAFRNRFEGHIFYLNVKDCREIGIFLKYLPSKNNIYHCELHKDEYKKELTDSQCKKIARKVKELVY